VSAAPLTGRRLYFVGIAGSGMSAYANVARALGAEVRGWDATETIFSERCYPLGPMRGPRLSWQAS
jgi:UDP-N-acetylmuramate-alanine ligase